MSEYKRFTVRREDGKAMYACSLRWEAEDEQTILERLAELEDKIESGLLIDTTDRFIRKTPNLLLRTLHGNI